MFGGCNLPNCRPLDSQSSRRTAAAARPVVVLPCKHAFHAKCLENWFATSLARLSDADDLTCPLCRQAVPAAPRRRLDGEEHKDATGDVELRGV